MFTDTFHADAYREELLRKAEQQRRNEELKRQAERKPKSDNATK